MSEKSSLSQSFDAPKCYGTTRNQLQPQCEVKLIGHVLQATDTLQGLAIKYGVTVEQLRRTNKIWTNDNIHLLKILKVPVKKDCEHYLSTFDVSDDESNTDDSGIYVDRTFSHIVTRKGAERSASVFDGIKDESKQTDNSSKKSQNFQTTLGFLQQLDARIKDSKQESEKLRTVSGPKVIADVEKSTRSCEAEDDLFRPLKTESHRRQRGQILASKRVTTKVKSNLQDSEEQFFEL